MIITDEKTLVELGKSSTNVQSEELSDLVTKLEQALNWSANNGKPGIGLAAPQIGISKKIFIIRIPGHPKFDLNIVNAEIKEKYDVFFFDNEGCLSFPDTQLRTKRYKEIMVVNNLTFPNSFILTGLPAVIAQHEMEHLNGETFFNSTR